MKRILISVLIIFSLAFIFAGCSTKASDINTYTGTIESSTVNIQPEIAGRIINLYVNNGDTVKKGDKIALLDVSQYKEQARTAKDAIDIANIKYNTIKKSNTMEADIAKLNVDQAQSAYNLANLMIEKGTITSPIDGIVTDINLNKGEMVVPGSNIAQVSDLNNLYIKIYVPEKHLSKVSLNKDVTIKVDSINNSIKGKVIFIASEGEFTPKNTVTKTSKEDIVFEVKIQIKDHINNLKPGMLADVTL